MKKIIFYTVMTSLFSFEISYAQLSSWSVNQFFAKGCDPEVFVDTKVTSFNAAISSARQNEIEKKYCQAAEYYSYSLRFANPTSSNFKNSLLKTVENLYSAKEWDLAITAAKKYISWNSDADLASDRIHFLLTQSFFNDRGSAAKDQNWNLKAQKAASDYLKKFPNGKYKSQVLSQLKVLYNELAEKEMHVAKIYLKEGEYSAVALRMEYLIKNFPASDFVPEGFYLLALSYKNLNQNDDIKLVLSIMKKRFPGSAWTQKVGNL